MQAAALGRAAIAGLDRLWLPNIVRRRQAEEAWPDQSPVILRAMLVRDR